MAEHRYRARGPENRTALITIRVTPEDRDGLHKLAAERGETLSRMLLAPWTRAKRQRSATRPDATVPSPEVAAEAQAERGSRASAPEQPERRSVAQPSRPSHEVAAETHPAVSESSVSACEAQEQTPTALPVKPARGRRVIAGQVELMFGELGGER